MDGAADVAESSYTPFRGARAALRRRALADLHYHGCITVCADRARPWRPSALEIAIRDLKYGGWPLRRGAWLAVQVMAHNLAQAGRAGGDHQDPPHGSSPSPDGSPARRAASLCICHGAGPGKTSSVAPGTIARPAISNLTA